eukprot:Gregarina_sp_Poly_1__10124@NODE_68_length_16344_cov_127_756773_g58_i0_p2_GENE_NODE_68_length_16344_cov_127_756773_g58_i0NODE_68_length_16344_cov_127_756773_g58_i0_p2_ORF_typecomplete_len900_score153_66WD40/PF00400_32/0_015WD40/PF00400_32/1_5e02WD40/PF00400_32/0_016WD40/PF00400_32/0_86WD40/PF00400_32/31WD40/PF00400_32/2_6e03WD40/PF00400_32/5_1e02WD40/PF00400_32/0_02WD40/PF00400_32/0_00064WD40/PF00400_32/3_1e02ANAPC4_WD40/PF12894_7/0_53ANAPC4_WD40/PF12894_7/1_2e02ANAPC4_WD40/PF12894_7/8_1e02ANAPC4
MSATLIAAIPPQSYTDANLPLHVQATVNGGQRIAYGCSSGVVLRCLPDQVSFKFRPVETFLGSKKPILSAAVAPNGRAVVAGDSDGFCYVWLKAKGGIEFVPYKLDGLRYVKMIDIAISPDSRRLAIVGVDKYSKRLAAAILIDGGMAIGKIEGHTKGIAAVTFSPVKPYHIITGGFDGMLCQHEGPPFKIKRQVTAVTDQQIYGTRFSPCGQFVAACGTGGWIGVFDGLTLTSMREVYLPGAPRLVSLAWSPSAKGFAAVGEDYKMRIIESSALSVLQTVTLMEGKDEAPKGVGWSQTNWIVVPCKSGHIKGWRVHGASAKSTSESLAAETKRMEVALEEEAVRQGDAADDPNVDETSPSAPVVQTDAIGTLDEQPTFTWYGPKGNPTAVAFDSATGNLVVGTSLGYVMFLSTNQTVPSCFQVSRLEKEVTVKSCLINEKCAVAVTADGGIRFFRVRTTNIKAGEIRNRIRETLEITSAGHGQSPATVYQSATKQELVLVASAQVEKTPLRLVFLDKGKSVGLLATCGNLFVYSVDKALNSSDAQSNLRHEWNIQLMGKPTAVATSGDGTLLCVALWPASDYPQSKFGPNRSPRPAKSPRSPRPKTRLRGTVAFKTDKTETATTGGTHSPPSRGKSFKPVDTFTHLESLHSSVHRSGTLAPPTPTPPTPLAQKGDREEEKSSHPAVSISAETPSMRTSGSGPLTKFDSTAIDKSTGAEASPSSPQGPSVSLVVPNETPSTAMEEEVYEEDQPKEPLIEVYEIDSTATLDGFRFICVLETHIKEISAVALNHNGSLLASADLKREIKVFEIESRKALIESQWNYHSTKVSGLDWSPDGTKLVSASTNEVFIWDIDKPFESISVKDAQTGNIQFVRFIFNNIVVSAGSDGVMKVYEVSYD